MERDLYKTVLVEERVPGGGVVWFAEHPALRGCNATGSTQGKALENLAVSRKAWLDVAAKLGRAIPTPPPVSETVFIKTVYARQTEALATDEDDTDAEASGQVTIPVALAV